MYVFVYVLVYKYSICIYMYIHLVKYLDFLDGFHKHDASVQPLYVDYCLEVVRVF